MSPRSVHGKVQHIRCLRSQWSSRRRNKNSSVDALHNPKLTYLKTVNIHGITCTFEAFYISIYNNSNNGNSTYLPKHVGLLHIDCFILAKQTPFSQFSQHPPFMPPSLTPHPLERADFRQGTAGKCRVGSHPQQLKVQRSRKRSHHTSPPPKGWKSRKIIIIFKNAGTGREICYFCWKVIIFQDILSSDTSFSI